MNYWDKAFFKAYVKMIMHPNTTYRELEKVFSNWLERGIIDGAKFAILIRFTTLIKSPANPLPYNDSMFMQLALNERKEG